MHPVFDPVADPLWPVAGSDDVYPIRRIFCVGRNYAAHAREMGMNPDRDPPFFFTKFADAYAPDGAVLPYPPGTQDYHHEVELVLAMSGGGAGIPAAQVREHIYGYAVGLDMTRRDLQLAAREKGRPWDTGKNFDASAPLGALARAEDVGAIRAGRIELTVNGAVTQEADIADLIWNIEEIVEHLSRLYALRAGDLIMTGTPAGVAAVKPGDELTASIEGLPSLQVTVGPEA